jgi:hypothetical protein
MSGELDADIFRRYFIRKDGKIGSLRAFALFAEKFSSMSCDVTAGA